MLYQKAIAQMIIERIEYLLHSLDVCSHIYCRCFSFVVHHIMHLSRCCDGQFFIDVNAFIESVTVHCKSTSYNTLLL
jgi:hypothetical protein